jgi:ribosomal protein S18 acetylase RimI-like enzyme
LSSEVIAGIVLAGIVLRDAATGLRPATVADQPFIRQLFKSARAGEFKAAGLPDAALEILLEQQFRAQAAGYAAQFPRALSLIVLYQDEPIGRLILQIGETKAFSSEVGPGSRQENASKQETRAPFRFNRNGKGSSWHMIDVVLLPSVRGHGIGTDLIEAVARAAHHHGARELHLTVLSGNAAARRLYARLGFIETASGVHMAMSKPLGD